MTRVWDEAMDVEGTSLLVLLALADYAGTDEGAAFPSVETLCRRTRRKERTVQDALSELEEKGWLRREPRPGRSTIYHLQTPAAHRTPAESAPPQPTAVEGCGPPQLEVRSTAPITITEPSSNEVGVSEVSTEETSPPTPTEVSTVEHPFPTFAKAALADHTTAEKNDWIAAWETVDSIAKAWEPTMHLTKYLADRKRNQKRPVAEEWVKWFVQDEHQAQADAAASVEDERDSRPWYE
jgi:DNA-binding MarR family transcriptional regulator